MTIERGAIAVLLALLLAGQGQTWLLRRQVAGLEERLGRSVDVVTKADLEAAKDALGVEIRRRISGVEETIRAIPRGKDTVFIREVSRPGPPGPPGQPGAPGRTGPPGTPLIPPEEQPRAREEAAERIVAWFDEGTLVNCDTPGQPPLTVEFLRQPGGRLLSTAPCVWRINDETVLREPKRMAAQRLLDVRPYLGLGWVAGGFEAGVGADVLHVGDISLGADLRFARGEVGFAPLAFTGGVGLYHLAATVSAPAFGPHLRLQGGYAWALRPDVPSSWMLGVAIRW